MKTLNIASFEGRCYKVRSKKTIVPDFSKMTRTAVFLWLIANTYPQGYQKERTRLPNISLNVK